jgi:hypothetical protein
MLCHCRSVETLGLWPQMEVNHLRAHSSSFEVLEDNIL